MKFRGFFVSVSERSFTKKDGTQGKAIECMFQVAGERDIIRLSTWSSRDINWCKENSITTGTFGEVTVHFGENNYGWYEQVILGFKSQAQIDADAAASKKKEEDVRPAPKEKTPEMQEAAQRMVAEAQEAAQAAAANGEGSDLPF